jgi:hypothetical protein
MYNLLLAFGIVMAPAEATNYVEAYARAERQGRMLVLYFHDEEDQKCLRFEREVLNDLIVRAKLQECAFARPPVTAASKVLHGQPGIVIIDLTGSPNHGQIVSQFPITDKLSYTAEQMRVILSLPTGSLTQRTLIYAVRVHPEGPASTSGKFDPYLAKEAESHSANQARRQQQGHHGWDARFHRINAKFPGLTASEVCAESWPGESLVEAAVECVNSWRQSPGHWRAVKQACPVYGYDMKRGRNGVWYATGIFGQE